MTDVDTIIDGLLGVVLALVEELELLRQRLTELEGHDAA